MYKPISINYTNMYQVIVKRYICSSLRKQLDHIESMHPKLIDSEVHKDKIKQDPYLLVSYFVYLTDLKRQQKILKSFF